MSDVTSSDLHDPDNNPATLNIAPGVTLNDVQRKHVAIVLDLFQLKGTMAKFMDNFTEDAVYEDLFVDCKNRDEVAGQLLHPPTICRSGKTRSHEVVSNTPKNVTDGTGASVPVNELAVKIKHALEFKSPLPAAASTVEINTTLIICSSDESGRIVRLQDRPDRDIPDSSVLSVFKRMNAVGVPKVTGLPRDEKADAEKFSKEQPVLR